MSEHIEIAALDRAGRFSAYAAGPVGRRTVIMVIQEIFGIDSGIRSMVDDWDAAGYRTLAPEFFWRITPGIE